MCFFEKKIKNLFVKSHHKIISLTLFNNKCFTLFLLIRKKCSGWCTCGLCVETRRSSTPTLLGDCSTSLPPARNRSSETGFAQNTLSPGEYVLYANRALQPAGNRTQEIRGQLSGTQSHLTAKTLWSSVAQGYFTFCFLQHQLKVHAW